MLIISYLLPLIVFISWVNAILGFGIFLVAFFLNSYLFRLIKIIPYKIEIKNESVICTEFLFSRKRIVFPFSDIETIKGGIFDRSFTGLYRIILIGRENEIGYFKSIKGFTELNNSLLKNVNSEVYRKLLKNMGVK